MRHALGTDVSHGFGRSTFSISVLPPGRGSICLENHPTPGGNPSTLGEILFFLLENHPPDWTGYSGFQGEKLVMGASMISCDSTPFSCADIRLGTMNGSVDRKRRPTPSGLPDLITGGKKKSTLTGGAGVF